MPKFGKWLRVLCGTRLCPHFLQNSCSSFNHMFHVHSFGLQMKFILLSNYFFPGLEVLSLFSLFDFFPPSKFFVLACSITKERSTFFAPTMGFQDFINHGYFLPWIGFQRLRFKLGDPHAPTVT